MSETQHDARKSEVAGEASFEWRTVTFTLETDYSEWSVDLVESIEEGKSVGIVRGALGPEQWLIAKPMCAKVKDLNELAALISKALGFGSTGE